MANDGFNRKVSFFIMSWQDVVVAVSNLLFTFSIFGQVYYGFRVKKGVILLKTSGLTFLGLYSITLAFFTLSLFFSAVISFINASLWLILFIQRLIYKKI